MLRNDIGDIHAFADAVLARPESPDLSGYLATLDLTAEETEEVTAHMAELNDTIRRSTELPMPRMAGWIG